MPDCWVERPRVFPYKCAVSGKGDVESGPYYEFPVEYLAFDGGPSCRLYISAKYMSVPFSRPGAPDAFGFAELVEELEQSRQRVMELETENEELTATVEAERDVFARARARKAPARRKAAA